MSRLEIMKMLSLYIMLTILLFGLFPGNAFAVPVDPIQDVRDIDINSENVTETDNNTNPLNPRDYYTQPEEYQAEVDDKYKGQNPFERMIAGLFTSLSTGIYEILGIKDPLMLIFDYDPMFDIGNDHISRENLYLGIYDQSEMSVITVMYKTFESYLPLWLFVAIVLTGLLMVFAGFGGDPRLTAKQYISGILLTCVLLLFGPNLIDIVFDFVYSGVDIIKDLIERTAAERGIEIPKSLLGVLLAGFTRDLSATDVAIGVTVAYFLPIVAQITALPYAIVLFAIFIGAGILNWQYIVRKITLAVLIFMFPIVAGMAVFPNTRGALKMWFSEFFSNVFLVLAHAVVYGFLIMLTLFPGQPFTVIEILVFVLGLNGTVGIVRGMFGCQPARSGIWGGMSNMLGISSLMGLGRMVLGIKGGASGIGGLFTGKTARETMGQAVGQQASSGAVSTMDIDKVADIGNDLTPLQVSLMNAQLTDSETEEQRMEMAGPHKDLSIDGQMQAKKDIPDNPNSLGRRLGRAGGALAVGSVGALVTGMVTGQAGAGMAAGIEAGSYLTDGAVNTARNIKQAFVNPNSMGIYSAGQMLDPKSAVWIGRNIAGAPGAAVARAANIMTRPFNSEATSVADRVRTDIQNQYEAAQKEYLVSQQKMQIAQYELQQVEAEYLEVDKPNNFIYEAKKFYAENKLAEAKKEFHESQIRLKEAEIRKQHENDYVGIKMKMESIRRPEMQSSGGIN
jgi:hypothetical protein